MAEARHTVSPDRLTSVLRADWPGHTRLALAWRTRFIGDRGYRSSDDPVLPNPFATAIAGLAWG